MTLSKISLAAALLVAGLAATVQASGGIDYNKIANDANTVIIHANQAVAVLNTVNAATYPEVTALKNRAVDIRNRATTIRGAALQQNPNTAAFLAYALDTLQRAEVCEQYSNNFRKHAHDLHDNVTKQKASEVKEHFDEMGDKLRRIKNELD